MTAASLILFALPAAPASGDPSAAGSDTTTRSAKGKPAILDTLFWAPEIVVEGVRTTPDREIFNQPGFVGLVRLDEKKNIMADAATALSRSTGVKVKNYGGMGSFATMSIRGSSSTQVQFYLDGVPLNDAYSGMTNLADIALDDISRIEIFRGFSPSGFGSSSIGGTVNLVTFPSGNASSAGLKPEVEGLLSAGSYDSRRYHIAASAGTGPATINLSGGYSTSAGDFSFHDDNATPENPGDDVTATRINNDFSRWNFRGRVGLRTPGFKNISVNHENISRESGIPGTGANQSSRARLQRRRRITYLKMEPLPALSGGFHSDATAFYSWSAEEFIDPGGDIDLSIQHTDNRIVSWGGNLKTRYYARSLPVSASLFFEGKKERFSPLRYLPAPAEGPDRRRESFTLSASADLAVPGDRLIISLGNRSEWYSSEFYDEPPFPWLPPTPQGRIGGNRSTPSAGLRIMPAEFLTVKCNWGKYYRMPTFFEMFGNLGTVTGDSGLDPESGENRDVGIILSTDRVWMIEKLFFEAVYHYNETSDLILFFPNSQSTVKPQNIGAARIRGIEISGSGTFGKTLLLSGNYCWLDSRDTGIIPYYRGNVLPSRPRHQASLSVSYEKKRYAVAWETSYIGSNYLDRANTRKTGGRGIHCLALTIRPAAEGLSFTVEGNNLGNDQTSDVSGFPLPGRSFYASIRFEL